MPFRVAVVGASGFIGRHVVRELLDRGVEVTVTSRSVDRLAEFGDRPKLVEMNLARAGADAYESLGRPDAVMHLAWEGLPHYRSLHHFESELPRQYSFLSQLVRGGLPSMLVAGTCFEYGPQCGCLSESMESRPDNPYGFAKDQLRRQLQFLQQDEPFNLTWARLFYMYGDGQSENSLWQQLKRAVARGEARFAMSGGQQLRDFMPISTVATYLVDLALRPGNPGVLNICSGQPESVRSMVERWIVENDWKIALDLGKYPYPDYEPMAFWGDRRKLDGLLESS